MKKIVRVSIEVEGAEPGAPLTPAERHEVAKEVYAVINEITWPGQGEYWSGRVQINDSE